MRPISFPVAHELDGWDLYWARLEGVLGHEEKLAALRLSTGERARSALALESLPSHPAAAAMRRLFRAAGCDPTRYRPSSEALLRRVLKGEDLPAIHPFVDLNNCLSVALAVPCCVAAEGSFAPPVTLRAGGPGESYESLRGPFNLEGKPLLADAAGPFSSPITDSRRVRVSDATRRVWMVAYLPRDVVALETAAEILDGLLAAAPAAEIKETGVSR